MFKVHNDFIRLFFFKESKILLGKNYINLWILLGILFITFSTIGFANGGLKYLAKKMNDPFVNWVGVNIPFDQQNSISSTKKVLNANQELKQEYNYGHISGHNNFALIFKDKAQQNSYQANGRTVEYGNPILDEIFNKENLIKGTPFRTNDDLGIVIARSFLTKFGYDSAEDIPFLGMELTLKEGDVIVPIPVRAVVESLPGLSMFMTTSHFYYVRYHSPQQGNPFDPNLTQDLVLFVDGDTKKVKGLESAVEAFFNNRSDYKNTFDPEFTITPDSSSYRPGYKLSVDFDPKPEQSELDEMFTALIAFESMQKKETACKRIYNFKLYPFGEYRYNDQLSIHLNALDKVEELKKLLKDKYKIEIEMAQIQALKNYNLIANLTFTLSFFLIFFSILSISFFITNVFERHLDKIKVNIGTFKAFGLDSATLRNIYMLIIYGFLLVALLVAIIAAAILGNLGGVRAVISMFNFSLEPNELYFQLLSNGTYISILVVLIISYIFLRRSSKKIIDHSPGDLIYNRV